MAGSTQQISGSVVWDAERRGGGAFKADHAPFRADSPARRLQALARTIEREVVPRLVAARASSAPGGEGWTTELPADQIATFAALAVGRDPQAVLSYVQALRARGAGIQAVCLDLLAPTARHLGELWIADECSFTVVTVGLLRLHEALRSLAPEFRGERVPRPRARRALLATVPGAQHSFGLVMLAGCFRLAGWSVLSGTSMSNEHLSRLVSGASFDLIGLSAAAEIHIGAVTSAVRAVRRASLNKAAGIMVGGPLFIEKPELATLVGADATARDGSSAPQIAEALLASLRAGDGLDEAHFRACEARTLFRLEDLVSREVNQGVSEPGVVARRSQRGFGGSGDRGGG